MRHILSSHKTKKAEDVLTMKKLENNELISSIMVYYKLLQIRLMGVTKELIWMKIKTVSNYLEVFFIRSIIGAVFETH